MTSVLAEFIRALLRGAGFGTGFALAIWALVAALPSLETLKEALGL